MLRAPVALARQSREALAFARQAVLLRKDLRTRLPREASAGDDVVVLLHGLFASAGVLRPMRSFLEAKTGAFTATFSYPPGPGVQFIARRLAKVIRRLPQGARIHLVGHSMGGLAVRWYVQELGGDRRIVQTISLGSPFFGTRNGALMPAAAGRDIRPDSELLTRLRSNAATAPVDHLSILAADDTIVTEEAYLPGTERLEISRCGHNGLLYDRRVFVHLARRIRHVDLT